MDGELSEAAIENAQTIDSLEDGPLFTGPNTFSEPPSIPEGVRSSSLIAKSEEIEV